MDETEKHVHFVFKTAIKGITLSIGSSERIEFHDSNVRFVIVVQDPKNAPDGRPGLSCDAYASFPVSGQIHEFLVGLIHESRFTRVAENLGLPFEYNAETLIDAQGRYTDGLPLRLYYCPDDVRKLINEVHDELRAKATRFIELLRWRQGVNGPSQSINCGTLYWSPDESRYHATPYGEKPTDQVLDSIYGIRWTEENAKQLRDLWVESDSQEPLGHALWREADSLASTSPRSAILIVATALETAVKVHISRLAPKTSWLLEEAPAPPVHKMLGKYIPTLHNMDHQQLKDWEKLRSSFTSVQRLFEVRNKVAHTGSIPPEAKPVKEYLTLVHDLLCLIDSLEGYEWAKEYASHEFRKKLGWPTSPYRNMKVIFRRPL